MLLRFILEVAELYVAEPFELNVAELCSVRVSFQNSAWLKPCQLSLSSTYFLGVFTTFYRQFQLRLVSKLLRQKIMFYSHMKHRNYLLFILNRHLVIDRLCKSRYIMKLHYYLTQLN